MNELKKLTQAWGNDQWQFYSYDGDGRRVKRNVNGAETWQVYGISKLSKRKKTRGGPGGIRSRRQRACGC
jgi:YD repeat-containing protein